MGADLSIDSTADDFVKVVQSHGGADVILDMVAGSFTHRYLDTLNHKGRLVTIPTQVRITIQSFLGVFLFEFGFGGLKCTGRERCFNRCFEHHEEAACSYGVHASAERCRREGPFSAGGGKSGVAMG